MITKLSGDGLSKAAPFFEGTQETMVWSVLDGSMGSAWADDAERPRSVQLLLADFCFFGGKPHAELAAHLEDRTWVLAADPSPEWAALLSRMYEGRHRTFPRYAIRKDTSFDRERLRRFAAALPDGFRLRRIDAGLYDALLRQDWSRDFCSNFRDAEDYLRRGIGYAVTREGEAVAGASSYTVYRGGIEIEIDTREDCRRKGLALCCASALILACLERGLYPSWDAATPVSVALAEKLGYRFDREYTTYLLHKEALC